MVSKKEETMDTIQLEAVREEYLLCRQIDGLAPGTLEIYSTVTRLFCEYLKGEEITPTRIRGFIAWLGLERNPTTVNIYTRALRTYVRWLVQEGYLPEDPMRDVRTPKVPKKSPNVLSEEEVAALLRVAKGRPRDYAILLFLLDTGVRASELCDLHIEDVYLLTRTARVFGKCSKERIVFFSPPTAKALARWLSVRPHKHYEDSLFLGVRGEPLTRHGLGHIVTRLAAKAGIKRRIGPHTFRHTFATLYVKNGGDAHSLMRLMGHASTAMAQVYVDLVGRDLAEAHQRYSPVMRLQRGR
jgi:integrase/recombinase XerD